MLLWAISSGRENLVHRTRSSFNSTEIVFGFTFRLSLQTAAPLLLRRNFIFMSRNVFVFVVWFHGLLICNGNATHAGWFYVSFKDDT